ncbi:unnamed protein product, partial [Notodromas monacha]
PDHESIMVPSGSGNASEPARSPRAILTATGGPRSSLRAEGKDGITANPPSSSSPSESDSDSEFEYSSPSSSSSDEGTKKARPNKRPSAATAKKSSTVECDAQKPKIELSLAQNEFFREKLSSLLISRGFLEKWCHYPKLNNILRLNFVRVCVSPENFVVSEIERCIETSTVYKFGFSRTNLALIVRNGSSRAIYTLDKVSDGELSLEEVRVWYGREVESDEVVPSDAEFEKRRNSYKNAMCTELSYFDAREMAEIRERFTVKLHHPAEEKSRLILLRQAAHSEGDLGAFHFYKERIEHLQRLEALHSRRPDPLLENNDPFVRRNTKPVLLKRNKTQEVKKCGDSLWYKVLSDEVAVRDKAKVKCLNLAHDFDSGVHVPVDESVAQRLRPVSGPSAYRRGPGNFDLESVKRKLGIF